MTCCEYQEIKLRTAFYCKRQLAVDYLYFSPNRKINPLEKSKIIHAFMSSRNAKLLTFMWKRETTHFYVETRNGKNWMFALRGKKQTIQ